LKQGGWLGSCFQALTSNRSLCRPFYYKKLKALKKYNNTPIKVLSITLSFFRSIRKAKRRKFVKFVACPVDGAVPVTLCCHCLLACPYERYWLQYRMSVLINITAPAIVHCRTACIEFCSNCKL